MEKFSQPADENGHVLLPGRHLPSESSLTMHISVIFELNKAA